MGLLKESAIRLLRERWANPTMLAEELFAILNSDLPLSLDGPITIENHASDEPAITIKSTTTGDTALRFTRDNGDGTQSVLLITYEGDVLSGDTPLAEDPEPGDEGFEVEGEDEEEEDQPSTTVFLGKVISGSGSTYQVELYGNGSSQPATATVTATVPQIDAAETIPAGTWLGAVHAFTSGGSTAYEFQVPVWLGP